MGFPPRIYLTGFMASGKSTVGPILATALGYQFVDMDLMIEEHAAQTIPEIFASEGEGGFRHRERDVLVEVSRLGGVVIATGGGALASDRNMTLARSTGTVVYLEADEQTIAERTSGADNDRPLLSGSAHSSIRTLLAKRREHYERAHITVDVNRRTAADIASEITRRLSE